MSNETIQMISFISFAIGVLGVYLFIIFPYAEWVWEKGGRFWEKSLEGLKYKKYWKEAIFLVAVVFLPILLMYQVDWIYEFIIGDVKNAWQKVDSVGAFIGFCVVGLLSFFAGKAYFGTFYLIAGALVWVTEKVFQKAV